MTANKLNWKNPLPNLPWIESPFFNKIFTPDIFSEQTIQTARSLHEKGYAIIDFPAIDFDSIVARIKDELYDLYDWEKLRNGGNSRIQDAWKFSSAVKQLACHQAIIELLENLYGRIPIPFQTLNFPVGTEQEIHTDSVHFSSIPERYMCGVWIALEDIHQDAGPLIYVPGSHKLPIFLNEHVGKFPNVNLPYANYADYQNLWEQLIENYNLKNEYFLPRKGQALIWCANLLHGGAPRTDRARTRHSQVTHYYFEDCAYYTPLSSLESVGLVYHREIINIKTGKKVATNVNGIRLDDEFVNFVSLHGKRGKQLLNPIFSDSIPKDFNDQIYLQLHPDVAKAGMGAKQHYLLYGIKEGRKYKDIVPNKTEKIDWFLKMNRLIGIGFEKCGTTYLNQLLSQSDLFLVPREKETFFFNNDFQKGIKYYQSKYEINPSKNSSFIVDITPSYLRGGELILNRIKEFHSQIEGQSKYVICLRNQVYRAFSLYVHDLFFHWSRFERNTSIEKPYNFSFFDEYEKRNEYYFTKYSASLEQAFDILGKENILVLFQEIDFQDLNALSRKLSNFLQVDCILNEIKNANRVHVGKFPKFNFEEKLSLELPDRIIDMGHQNLENLKTAYKKWTRSLTADKARKIYMEYFESDRKELETALGVDLSFWHEFFDVSY